MFGLEAIAGGLAGGFGSGLAGGLFGGGSAITPDYINIQRNGDLISGGGGVGNNLVRFIKASPIAAVALGVALIVGVVFLTRWITEK